MYDKYVIFQGIENGTYDPSGNFLIYLSIRSDNSFTRIIIEICIINVDVCAYTYYIITTYIKILPRLLSFKGNHLVTT